MPQDANGPQRIDVMRFTLFLFFFLCATFNYALSLKPDSPAPYVIQAGDSLWSISAFALLVRSSRAVYLHNTVINP